MTQFWTRTRRYVALVWIGAAAVEAVVLEMARRTNNSWLLLLALALLVVPIAATEMTLRWFGRAPRKRWKRHDMDAALAAGQTHEEARASVSAPPQAAP
ncbi:MAG TPA: hypothetical protein VEX86_02130 [Longimicrobium sp.]|nr:hypothetical protein [Longimicrobium sp.]